LLGSSKAFLTITVKTQHVDTTIATTLLVVKQEMAKLQAVSTCIEGAI
jgi:hypothetical protein